MKNSELRKLISQYKETLNKQKKKHTNNFKLSEKREKIEQRYFHETGITLKADLKDL